MGLLTKEQKLLSALSDAFIDADVALKYVQNWVIGIAHNEPEPEEADVLELLVHYAKAASTMHYIKQLDEQEKEKVIHSLPAVDYMELIGQLGSLEGMIEAIDKTDAELLESTIDKQLVSRINDWKKYLEAFKPNDDGLDQPLDPGMDNLMEDRDFLEYTKIGIQLIQSRAPRFKGIKNLKTFEQQLDEADKTLKKVLGKRRELVYWADPVFWWRHKPQQ